MFKTFLNDFLPAAIQAKFLILMPKASIWCHCVFFKILVI